MRVLIEGSQLPGLTCGPSRDFPGYANIHVGVQRRNKPGEHLDLQPGDAHAARWAFEADVRPGGDLLGPYIQGGPSERFIYLSWGTVDDDGFHMFRRAKLILADIDAEVLAAAQRSGTLVARLGLTDAKGHPLCARVKPPAVEWSAAPATA